MPLDLAHIEAIARRVAESNGLELYEVEMRGGGKGRTLRIVIDRPGGANESLSAQVSAESGLEPGAPSEVSVGGVTHEDCAAVSREVSAILDVEDAVPGASYMLEVSSPGLDRKLRGAADFSRFTGSRVKLMTREPVENNRHWEGRLEAFDGARLLLDVSAASRTKQKKMGLHKSESARRIEIELGNVERANLVPEM